MWLCCSFCSSVPQHFRAVQQEVTSALFRDPSPWSEISARFKDKSLLAWAQTVSGGEADLSSRTGLSWAALLRWELLDRLALTLCLDGETDLLTVGVCVEPAEAGSVWEGDGSRQGWAGLCGKPRADHGVGVSENISARTSITKPVCWWGGRAGQSQSSCQVSLSRSLHGDRRERAQKLSCI